MNTLKLPKDLLSSFGEVPILLVGLPLLVGVIHLFTGTDEMLINILTFFGSTYALYAGLKLELFASRKIRNGGQAFIRVLGLNIMMGLAAGILVYIGIVICTFIFPFESTITLIVTFAISVSLGYLPYILWGDSFPVALENAHENTVSEPQTSPGEPVSENPGATRSTGLHQPTDPPFARGWVMRKLFLTTAWFQAAIIGAFIWQESVLHPSELADLSALSQDDAARQELMNLIQTMAQHANPGGGYIIASVIITLASLMVANAFGLVLGRAYMNARQSADTETVFE
jgi:hypothetical protein